MEKNIDIYVRKKLFSIYIYNIHGKHILYYRIVELNIKRLIFASELYKSRKVEIKEDKVESLYLVCLRTPFQF